MANKDTHTSSDDHIPDHIVEMMGPTPAAAQPGALANAATSAEKSMPASAPLIPTDKLPKEVMMDKPLKHPSPSSTPPDPKAVPVQTDTHDDETDALVDEISHQESDTILEHEDEELAAAFQKEPQPSGIIARIRHGISSWWHNPKARNATLAGLAVILLVGLVVPQSRYFVLNTLGVRASLRVTVLDEGTRQPLKNVAVKVGDTQATTNTEGQAELTNLKLGKRTLEIEKVAFAPLARPVTVGWGSNPQGDVGLTPTGAQYRFLVTDYLSGKPIQKAEATSGVASALANEKGEIVLTVDVDDAETISVNISHKDLRTETRTINTSIKDTQKIKMVPAKQHVFVSKRSGKFDVYRIDADGKNEKLLLAATGAERDDMVAVTHPTQSVAALVSTRDGTRNDDGFLLSTLHMIDVETGEMTEVAESERIQVIDWVGDRLVYVAIVSGQSASSPKRHRLLSYNQADGTIQELAYSNYFNDVLAANGVIYYAPSSAYQQDPVALHRVNPDGTDNRKVLEKEVWNIFRVAYDQLQFSSGQQWYEYNIADVAPTALEGAPADPKNRLYRTNAGKSQSAWIDQRDGKGVLLAYGTEARKDKVLRTQSGIRNPLYWLSNEYIVYRVSTDQETADYVMSIEGGEPQKVQDVTNTGGIDRWYYYQ